MPRYKRDTEHRYEDSSDTFQNVVQYAKSPEGIKKAEGFFQALREEGQEVEQYRQAWLDRQNGIKKVLIPQENDGINSVIAPLVGIISYITSGIASAFSTQNAAGQISSNTTAISQQSTTSSQMLGANSSLPLIIHNSSSDTHPINHNFSKTTYTRKKYTIEKENGSHNIVNKTKHTDVEPAQTSVENDVFQPVSYAQKVVFESGNEIQDSISIPSDESKFSRFNCTTTVDIQHIWITPCFNQLKYLISLQNSHQGNCCFNISDMVVSTKALHSFTPQELLAWNGILKMNNHPDLIVDMVADFYMKEPSDILPDHMQGMLQVVQQFINGTNIESIKIQSTAIIADPDTPPCHNGTLFSNSYLVVGSSGKIGQIDNLLWDVDLEVTEMSRKNNIIRSIAKGIKTIKTITVDGNTELTADTAKEAMQLCYDFNTREFNIGPSIAASGDTNVTEIFKAFILNAPSYFDLTIRGSISNKVDIDLLKEIMGLANKGVNLKIPDSAETVDVDNTTMTVIGILSLGEDAPPVLTCRDDTYLSAVPPGFDTQDIVNLSGDYAPQHQDYDHDNS